MKRLVIGSLYFIVLWCIAVDSVLVEVEQGCLRGETKMTSTNMGKYYSFKGIPYAAPPVGDLRFKAPQPPFKWVGIRNATEHGSICMQTVSNENRKVIGSENCLYLNVYTPNLTPDRLLSVMVFIHGDSYTMGSGNSDRFGPDFLMSDNVILVTLNFRLGVLGFLATETEEIPGNAGLKDQIAALQWVQNNIKKFGGDPDSVTIFGFSSGAAMVTLHVISPAAKNLFKRAIAMSAAFSNDWSIEFKPKRRAIALGRELGRETYDIYQLINLFKSVDPEKLILARPIFLLGDEIYINILLLNFFTPVVEKKFGDGKGQYLTKNPFVLMCNRQINQVDYMMGHTDNEGLQSFAELEDKLFSYYSKYKEILVPLKIRLYRSPSKVLQLSNSVSKFYNLLNYYNKQRISMKEMSDFMRFNTYIRYQFDIYSFMEKMPKLPSVRRYFYVFRIYSSRNYYAQLAARKFGIRNATHGDDLLYLFDGSYYNLTVDVTSEAYRYIQLTCKLYTNFAKYGNPTPDDSLGATWPEYDPNKGFMSILRNGTLRPGVIPIYTGDLKFWRQLYLSVGQEPF